MALAIFNILVFPGFLFLSVYALALEYVDRKMYARLQNRKGPPWFQPLADFIKLLGKETIIPADVDKPVFKLLPVFTLAAVTSAFLYVPIWGTNSLFPFEGDLIVVLYLLTIPTLTFFLAGWLSNSLYGAIGSVRTVTQLFSYEVPLFMALLSPAILADTWKISGMAEFYQAHPLYILLNLPAFIVAIIAIQGKLERVPFDSPEAETEIVAGSFVEYSGRLFAIFRMAIAAELVVVASLAGAIFFPVFAANPWLGFLIYLLKTLIIVAILAVFKSIMARIRIDQMVMFCWRYLAPLAILQIIINLLLKGVLPI
ncbi:MAG: NADH-quinone oxidoreductase subunit H [Clostridiales bacterium]|nr:NADH-quinone oxidoreductase subunit H [Clostridiales bacterium]